MLSRVLLGGGSAVFYITVYAAYLRYGILSGFSAFIFLILVTGLSFTVSVTAFSQTISLIGLLGALIITFDVDLSFLGLGGFGIYMLAVYIFSSSIYFSKKWNALQLTSVIAVSGVLLRLYPHSPYRLMMHYFF